MTNHPIRSLLLLSLLLVPFPASPSGDDPPPSAAGPEYPVPKGSPEDQALWEKLVTTQNTVTTSRAEALRMVKQLEEVRSEQRLAEMAKQATGETAAKTEALRQKLLAAWNADFQTLTRQWPVDPRLGCRAERLDLEVAMESGDKAEVQRTRPPARLCLDKMTLAVNQMEKANRDLSLVIAEVQAAILAPAAPGAAQGGGKP
jgi:hypothetical protein